LAIQTPQHVVQKNKTNSNRITGPVQWQNTQKDDEEVKLIVLIAGAGTVHVRTAESQSSFGH